jgi:hypothetical protein
MPDALALSSSDCMRRPFDSDTRADRKTLAPDGRLMAADDERSIMLDAGLVTKALAVAARAARATTRTKDMGIVETRDWVESDINHF